MTVGVFLQDGWGCFASGIENKINRFENLVPEKIKRISRKKYNYFFYGVIFANKGFTTFLLKR